MLFLIDGGKGRGDSLINGMQRGNTRRAAEAVLIQGMQLPPFLRIMPALVCGESIWGFLPSEKAKQSSRRSFSQRYEGNSDTRLMAPTEKGFQGWLLVGRGKSDRTLITTLLGQVFSGPKFKTATQTKTG